MLRSPAVARGGLGARVEEEEAAVLEPIVVRMRMEGGAPRRRYDAEGESAARGEGHFGYAAIDIRFEHAGSRGGEGGPVHIHRDGDRPVHLGDLVVGLDLAQGYRRP